MMLFVDYFFRTLKQVYRSPTRMVLIIGFPLGFTLIFAFIFGGGGSQLGGSGDILPIGVIFDDDGTSINQWKDDFNNYTLPYSNNGSIDPLTNGFGRFFIDSLQGKTSLRLSDRKFNVIEFGRRDEALSAIRSQAVTLVIEIPFDFSLGILSGINSQQEILNGTPVVNDPLIRNTNLSVNLLGDPSFLDFQNARTDIEQALENFRAKFYGINLPAGNFETEFESIVSIELTSYDYFIPGFFTFALVLTASSVAGILGNERETRTLDRLKLSDLKPSELLTGITLNQLTTGALQLGMMFVAAYLFGFKGQGNPLWAFLICTLTIIPVLGLAFFVSAFVTNGRDATAIISILSAPIGFLSGAFLPVPGVPLIPNFVPTGIGGGLRALQLWDFFPFASSVSATRQILLFNSNLEQILPEIVFLVIGGVLFYVFGAFFLLRSVFKPEK